MMMALIRALIQKATWFTSWCSSIQSEAGAFWLIDEIESVSGLSLKLEMLICNRLYEAGLNQIKWIVSNQLKSI
jgi:hypothetical protein